LAATELAQVTALMDRRADAPPMTLTSPATLRIHTAPRPMSPACQPRCWPDYRPQ
jgi:hypothetical protein